MTLDIIFRYIRIITTAGASFTLIQNYRKTRDILSLTFAVITIFVQTTYLLQALKIVVGAQLNQWFAIIGIMHNFGYIVYIQTMRAEREQWQSLQN